jgi:ribosome maturation factor RimP
MINIFYSEFYSKRVGFPTLLFYMAEIRQKIITLAESLAGPHGLQLVEVEIAGSGRRPLVRVFIDKEGGVTLDECAKFSRALSALFDVEDPIPTAYMLEVSSPGLDRPLKKVRHFEQVKGKLARIVLKKEIEGQNVIIGRIRDVQGETIILVAADGEDVLIPFDTISRARLEIEL